MEGPSTKDKVTEWSEAYWPLVWRGNPNDQILNEYTFDMPTIEKILTEISKLSHCQYKAGNKIPVITAFVDPSDTSEIIYAFDDRHNCDSLPLDHSIMHGINKVSHKLKSKKSGDRSLNDDGYLCLNFDVYTTHEPCSMCAMALIHSRIKRCIFLQPMPRTGSLKPESGDSYCMHNNKLLNSKYEVFQWVGEKFQLPNMDESTCC